MVSSICKLAKKYELEPDVPNTFFSISMVEWDL